MKIIDKKILKIYVKNNSYYVYGHFRNVEEYEDDPYIAVFGYGKYNKVTNELIENEIDYMNENLKNDNHIFYLNIR